MQKLIWVSFLSMIFNCSLISITYAQNKTDLDSLEALLQEKVSDTLQVRILKQLTEGFKQSNVDKSMAYAEQLLQISEQLNDHKQMVYANRIIGMSYMKKGYDIDTILVPFQRAIKITEDNNLLKDKCTILDNLATVHRNFGQQEKAHELLQEALTIAEQNGWKKEMARTLSSLSYLFIYEDEEETAKVYANRALKYAEETNSLSLIARINNGLANIYYNDLDSALIFCNRALEAYKILNEKYEMIPVLANMGHIHSQMGNYTEADKYFQEGYLLAKEVGNMQGLATILGALGILNMNQEKYLTANDYFEEGLEVLGENGDVSLKIFCLERLSLSHEALNNYEEALYYHRLFYILNDSIYNLEKDQQLQEAEAKYEVSKKAAENELLKSQQARNQLAIRQRTIIGIAATLILLMIAGFLRYSNKQRKRQNELLEQKVKKRSEELLAANAELTEMRSIKLLEEAKSRFFANVSHEFRTPLTLIQAPLELVLKSGQLSNKHFTMLSQARRNSKQLLRLVGQILDLTKLDSNELTLNETKVLFYPFVRKVIASFETYAQQKQIDLKFEYDLNKNIRLEIDQDKMEKILNNYLSNAIKFTPKNGAVTLKISNIQKNIKIAVIDNGRGIPASELEEVFKRYYQVKNGQVNAPLGQMNYHDGGTGIGLSLCADYAKLMNGKVWAESPDEGEKGSIFFFEFPQKEFFGALSTEELDTVENEEKNILTSPVLIQKAAQQRNSTILIVEDNYDLQAFLSNLLSENYNVITKENGQAALDWLESTKQHPNLIISDVMMPRMNGFELLEALKTSDKYRHIPVMMLTARAEMKDKLQALRIGVDDYLLKPFNDVELQVRIKNLIENALNRVVESPEEEEIEEAEKTTMSSEDTDWLKELETVINENIDDFNLTADFVVKKMYISRSKLFRKIKKLTGLTFNQYLKEARLQKAKSILESGQFSTVKSVSYSVGIKQAGYFSRNYEARFGKRPTEYF